MNHHLIIGNGNLGAALKQQALKMGDSATILSQSSGFKYPEKVDLNRKFLDPYTHVWCSVGAGSIEAAYENIESFIDLHVRLPARLLQISNMRCKVILFSTDYLLGERPENAPPLNGYIHSKALMEQWFNAYGTPNDYCFRVGSLYGTTKGNFVSKFLKRYSLGDRDVVINPCHPTPAEWLAKLLLDQVRYPSEGIFDAIPSGSTTNYEWAREIVKTAGLSDFDIRPAPFDYDRPVKYKKIPRALPTWDFLWGKYGSKTVSKWSSCLQRKQENIPG